MAARGSALEDLVVAAFPWLVGGLVAAVPLLAIPTGDATATWLLVHLAAIVGFELALTARLAHHIDDVGHWFPDRWWPARRRALIAVASIVVVVTGVSALVTLASSAALRFQPSLQFLQLLSALDIAWVVAATTVAVRRRWRPTAALVAGTVIAVACVASLANYIRVVGLGPDGGWRLVGSELMRLVIPSDTVAALLAIGLVIVAVRSEPAAQPTAQARPQS